MRQPAGTYKHVHVRGGGQPHTDRDPVKPQVRVNLTNHRRETGWGQGRTCTPCTPLSAGKPPCPDCGWPLDSDDHAAVCEAVA